MTHRIFVKIKRIASVPCLLKVYLTEKTYIIACFANLNSKKTFAFIKIGEKQK